MIVTNENELLKFTMQVEVDAARAEYRKKQLL